MRLLLDTQVILWAVSDPVRLSWTVRTVLTDPSTVPTISVVSLWEIVIKQATGKLQLDRDLTEGVAEFGAEELPIRREHALAVADLPLHHRDPFDRMLVAQARHEGLTVVTSDRRLEAYSVAVLRADG